MLLPQRFHWNELQLKGPAENTLENSHGLELRERLGTTHLQDRLLTGRSLGRRDRELRHVERGDVADLPDAVAVDPGCGGLRVEAKVRSEPHFHEVRRPENHDVNAAFEQPRLAIALGGLERRIEARVAGVRGVDELPNASAIGRLN